MDSLGAGPRALGCLQKGSWVLKSSGRPGAGPGSPKAVAGWGLSSWGEGFLAGGGWEEARPVLSNPGASERDGEMAACVYLPLADTTEGSGLG